MLQDVAFQQQHGSLSPEAATFAANQKARKIVDARNRLLGIIKFHVSPDEQATLVERMRASKVKPTLGNINRHLYKTLLLPIDEIPEPERTIIIRSGRKERFTQ